MSGDIPYLQDGHPQHRLDLYLPASPALPQPTIMLLHGGGFVSGSKDSLRGLALHLAESGYAVVAPDYRLAPEFRFPSQIQDTVCAYLWILDNASKYRFDTGRIGLAGDSVGGNLAAMLASLDELERYAEGCLVPSRSAGAIRSVVVLYPVIDLTLETYGSFFDQYVGVDREVQPEVWLDASPLRWINGNEPPFLLIHGMWDVRGLDPLRASHAGVLPTHSKRQSLTRAPAGDAVEYLGSAVTQRKHSGAAPEGCELERTTWASLTGGRWGPGP